MSLTSKNKSKKSDYFENGKPVHKLSYCAFMDVLGFSARVSSSYENDSADDLLKSFHEILGKSITQFKEYTDESMLYFKSFTDNVILAHPRFSKDMESEFGFLLWAMNEYQFQMALRGFFIRGGLAMDQLFIDENSVYGAALLTAHDLESNVAVNPIVVLCDNTMALVDHHITFYSHEIAPQLRDVLKGSDGRYFLNYLTECVIDGDEQDFLDVKQLHQHKEQIEVALLVNAEVPKVLSKFTWLASYHNYFCDMMSNFPGYEDSLKVSGAFDDIGIMRLG